VVVGLLVDGMAEYHSLALLTPRVSTEHTIRRPLRADIQPLAPTGQIARTILKSMPLLVAKGVQRVVVLIDMEDRDECPGVFASDIENQVRALNKHECQVYVVVKARCYENWLICAISALKRQRSRFPHVGRITKHVLSDKGDSADAIELMRQCTDSNAAYEKVNDAKRIMTAADPHEIARNSRSFRRLLRILDDPKYKDQSRLP
jgi:hypothetical protein